MGMRTMCVWSCKGFGFKYFWNIKATYLVFTFLLSKFTLCMHGGGITCHLCCKILKKEGYISTNSQILCEKTFLEVVANKVHKTSAW